MRSGEQAQPLQRLTGARAAVVRACNISSMGILSLIAVVAAGLLVAQMLGIKPMAVLSGSMEPTYATGSVVFVDTNADAAAVAVGDTITYSLGESNTVVTHRVIAINQDEQLFITKGDANEDEDGPVPFSRFVGRTAGFYLPWVGSALLMVGTTQGIAVALFVLAFIIILLMLPLILTPAKPAEAAEGPQPATATAAKGRRRGGAGGAHFRAKEREVQ
ncbi:MAG: signal peptidase I [Coriobacteriales bacterium]|jgi:signal peptidase|nr:signal peptidase I [Coriobacteriales bacterium]